MKRITTAVALVAALVAPAAAPAKPTKTDGKNAAKECKAERKAMGKESFREKYGTNKNGKNAFGKCVSRTAREEAKERRAARKSAAKECKAERETLGDEAFRAKYGTNKNGKNAFGKCVSKKAEENEAEADAKDKEDLNAARACRDERKSLGDEAFRTKYGTNENKKNAFGKCVSAAQKDESGEAS